VIRIICVGKLKEPHYAQAAAEYLKRLERYARVETFEVREQTDRNAEVAKRKEAALISERLSSLNGYFTVALDGRGQQVSSEEFAELLKKQNLAFVIGGPDGTREYVLDGADMVLSLSKMTLPHQLARVVLLEQLETGKSQQAQVALGKDKNYEEYFVRRSFGGVQPDGTFIMSLYDLQILPDPSFKPMFVEISQKCKLTMTVDTAKSIAEWILRSIQEGSGKEGAKPTQTSDKAIDPMVR